MKAENPNISKIKENMSKLSSNSENSQIINNNLDNLDSNQIPIITQSINNLNQNKEINNYESEKNDIFDDKINQIINLQKDDIKLSGKKFLGKKTKLFENKCPNKFLIFNQGGENQKIRLLIDQFLKKEENANSILNHSSIKRRENSDNIRKKIKYRFIKNLIKTINQKLELAGSIKFFVGLPQNFVCNISKNINSVMSNKTFKELFSTFFNNKNSDVFEYLENEKNISEKIKYNCFKNLKLVKIFEEYLSSKEFENEIVNLELKGENDNYIHKYIKLASNFNNYFTK